MPNELTTGTRRTGNLIDFDPETPPVHVVLERSKDGISITVPWSGDGSPYTAWFGADQMRRPTEGSDDLSSRSVPKRLLFQDSHGSILLTGCWPRGFHYNLHGPGSGTVWARAAILDADADIDFDQPHGLQTEISSLRDWLNVTSWSRETDWDEDGVTARIRSLKTSPVEIRAFGGLDLELQQAWQVVPGNGLDQIVLLDTVRLSTRSNEPVPWKDHLELHQSIRDLLVLSRWRKESCVAVLAQREDDPLRTLDGKEHGRQWRHVVVPDDDRQVPPTGHRPHLIEYDDLGSAGIARWIALRDEFGRALDPVISGIDLDATANTLLAHTGPGLEALGYLLMLRDGDAPKQAASATLRERLERISADLGETVPFDVTRWASATVKTYNGLKHANRLAPDGVDVANAWRECVLAVRAWVALELGVSPPQMTARLKNDPQRHPYVQRE